MIFIWDTSYLPAATICTVRCSCFPPIASANLCFKICFPPIASINLCIEICFPPIASVNLCFKICFPRIASVNLCFKIYFLHIALLNLCIEICFPPRASIDFMNWNMLLEFCISKLFIEVCSPHMACVNSYISSKFICCLFWHMFLVYSLCKFMHWTFMSLLSSMTKSSNMHLACSLCMCMRGNKLLKCRHRTSTRRRMKAAWQTCFSDVLMICLCQVQRYRGGTFARHKRSCWWPAFAHKML